MSRSVNEVKDPRSVLKLTSSPPLTRGLPLASNSCTVTVEVLVPSAVIELGDAVMVEVVASAGPTSKVTVAEPISKEPNVPVTVASPVEVVEVRIAV